MWELSGSPKLLVYRKLAPPPLEQGEMLDRACREERAADLQAVEDFFRQHFRGADNSFTRAVSEFWTMDEFRGLLAPQLRLLLEEFKPPPGQEVYEGPERGTWLQGSPFRGLEEFRKEDAAVFFGRNKAVSEIHRSLLDNTASGTRSVFVLGTSGSGKSSVLQAGVAPALMRPGNLAGIAGWRYLCVKPSALGDDPFPGLARLLSAPKVLPELLEEFGTLDTLAESLRESASGGARLLRGALSRAEARLTPPPDWEGEARLGLFLILDQFEEFFSHQAVNPATGAAFLGLLKRSPRKPEARCGWPRRCEVTTTPHATLSPISWRSWRAMDSIFSCRRALPKFVRSCVGPRGQRD
ncbi:MAG: ATP-binding protein [Candidatus Competibacteraceae bacterium]|nr:ATP-binding protein [Candidatus Competibacteraceae bacterium]